MQVCLVLLGVNHGHEYSIEATPFKVLGRLIPCYCQKALDI